MPDTHDLNVKTVPAADLNPAPYNPRVDLAEHDDAFKQLRSSIEQWGLVEPLIVNARTGLLVAGHQRLRVAQHLGITEVPVVELDLDDRQERQLNIALNKTRGRWDDDKLADLLVAIRDDAADDDRRSILERAGFSERDVDNVLRRVAADKSADILDQLAAGVPKSEIGDYVDPADTPSIDRTAEGDQSVQRNYFAISYTVTDEQRDDIVSTLRTIRTEHDLETPSDALLHLVDWWTSNVPDAKPTKAKAKTATKKRGKK